MPPKDKKGKKTRKVQPKPEWNDCISDLTKLKATAEQLERKKLICKSRNAEIARLELVKKTVQRQKRCEELKREKAILMKELLYESDQLAKAFESTESELVKSSHLSSLSTSKYTVNTATLRGRIGSSEAPNGTKIAIGSITKGYSPRSQKRPFSQDLFQSARLASKLLPLYTNGDNSRIDTLNQILCNLFRALSELDRKINAEAPEPREHKIKPPLSRATTLCGFTEGLLGVFCKLIQLFQKVTKELEKEKEMREELNAEVSRQGSLLDELTMELTQIESARSKSDKRKAIDASDTSLKSSTCTSTSNPSSREGVQVRGPETCLMKRPRQPCYPDDAVCRQSGSSPTLSRKSAMSTKGCVSTPGYINLSEHPEGKLDTELENVEVARKATYGSRSPFKTSSPLLVLKIPEDVGFTKWKPSCSHGATSSPTPKRNSPACVRVNHYKPWTRVNPEVFEIQTPLTCNTPPAELKISPVTTFMEHTQCDISCQDKIEEVEVRRCFPSPTRRTPAEAKDSLMDSSSFSVKQDDIVNDELTETNSTDRDCKGVNNTNSSPIKDTDIENANHENFDVEKQAKGDQELKDPHVRPASKTETTMPQNEASSRRSHSQSPVKQDNRKINSSFESGKPPHPTHTKNRNDALNNYHFWEDDPMEDHAWLATGLSNAFDVDIPDQNLDPQGQGDVWSNGSWDDQWMEERLFSSPTEEGSGHGSIDTLNRRSSYHWFDEDDSPTKWLERVSVSKGDNSPNAQPLKCKWNSPDPEDNACALSPQTASSQNTKCKWNDLDANDNEIENTMPADASSPTKKECAETKLSFTLTTGDKSDWNVVANQDDHTETIELFSEDTQTQLKKKDDPKNLDELMSKIKALQSQYKSAQMKLSTLGTTP